MKEAVNNFWRNFRKYPDIWFFFVFLLSFPLGIRKVIFFFPLSGAFNEYTGIYLYASDLLFGLTVATFLISSLHNKRANLSILYSQIRPLFHNLYFILPAFLVSLSFLSIVWSQNHLIAFYQSIRLWECYLIYLYVSARFIPAALFHVEQLRSAHQINQNVPRGTLGKTEKINRSVFSRSKSKISYYIKNSLNKGIKYFELTFRSKSGKKYGFGTTLNAPLISPAISITSKCSTWNIFLKLIVILGLIESIIGIGQFLLQHSIGLFFLKESNISPDIPGVAKIILDGDKYVRAYGLFPHPNILGGFLLFSIIITLLYKKQLFHVEHWLENSQNSLIVPRGTINQGKNISREALIRDNRSAGIWEKHGFNKSKYIAKTTFRLKSDAKRFLMTVISSLIFKYLNCSTCLAGRQAWNNLRNTIQSKIYSEAPNMVSATGVVRIVPRGTIRNYSYGCESNCQSLIIAPCSWQFFKMSHLPCRQAGVEHLRNTLYETLQGVKAGVSLINLKIQKILEIVSLSLRLFHVEQLFQKLTSGTSISRGTNWLVRSFENVHFSSEKFKFRKLWLINAALWIQIIALFLSFSKSAIIGLLIAIAYIKLFHLPSRQAGVEQFGKYKSLEGNVPRGTFLKTKLLKFSGYNILKQKFQLFHLPRRQAGVEQLKKITLVILIALFSAILLKPDFNSLKPNFQVLLLQSLEERMLYINFSPIVVSFQDLVNVPRGTIHDLLILAFGIGSGQFVLSLSEYTKKSLEIWQFQPVHNIYLEMWSELGIVGLGLFLWLIWKLFHVEQSKHFAEIRNCSTCLAGRRAWNNLSNVESGQIVPPALPAGGRGTFIKQETRRLENKQGTFDQKFELEESILCNYYSLMSIKTTLRYFQGIFLGLLFIGLFDHYLWDIWPEQVLLWLTMGIIVGLRIKKI